jgi:hypothetical protein
MKFTGRIIALMLIFFSVSFLPSCNLDDIIDGDPVDDDPWNPKDTTWTDPWDTTYNDPWDDKDTLDRDPWDDKDTLDRDPWNDKDTIVVIDGDTIWIRGDG